MDKELAKLRFQRIEIMFDMIKEAWEQAESTYSYLDVSCDGRATVDAMLKELCKESVKFRAALYGIDKEYV